MNRNRNAVILIACALVLAIGAYILFSDSTPDAPTYRQEVTPPAETAKAPSWVDTGQSAQPDYSSANTQAHNATPTPEAPPTKVIEVSENQMVTFTFVESLADFMLHRFSPQTAQGKPATFASAKALNMYYGQELDGFSVTGDDVQRARKTVLDYAFTPEMIKQLYSLYAPVLMAHIVDTATTDSREYKLGTTTEKRILSKEETAVMLRLNARKIEQTATIFRAIASDPSITKMAGQYLTMTKAVKRANMQLQNDITEGKSTSKSSSRLKQAIMQREQIKKSIIGKLKKACPECSESELFYLVQWSYRRVLDEPDKKLVTFDAAAEVMDDLVSRFQATANELE